VQYLQILPQWVDDQNMFTAELEAVKSALRRNEKELEDLRVSA